MITEHILRSQSGNLDQLSEWEIAHIRARIPEPYEGFADCVSCGNPIPQRTVMGHRICIDCASFNEQQSSRQH